MLEKILAEIDGEIEKLQHARKLLSSIESEPKRGPGRPPKTMVTRTLLKKSNRTMSIEAREKIRQAQIARWAATKEKGKNRSR